MVELPPPSTVYPEIPGQGLKRPLMPGFIHHDETAWLAAVSILHSTEEHVEAVAKLFERKLDRIARTHTAL